MIRCLVIFLMFTSAAFSQQALEGKVVDKQTGKPVPFASLVIVGTSKGTSANVDGQFSLIVSDTFSVKVTCIGYKTQIIRSAEEVKLIQLESLATQLNEVIVFTKEVNPNKVVRKAFAAIQDNYDTESFLQKFFYRYYSKTDSVYERLIEASAEVWKDQGYKTSRRSMGEKEEMRIVQLRRSLDIKGMVQEQKPLHLGYILQSDIVGYQASLKNEHLDLFEGASSLRTNLLNYTFSFDGITNYDGQEVYKIDYVHKKDSLLTTSGYQVLPQASGSLYITTKTFAFVKTEEVKDDEYNTIRTTAYYRKSGDKYYPYHFIREGENRFITGKISSFHIELISVDIRPETAIPFTGNEPGRDELLKIPYDSTFWSHNLTLKTTPLEDEIISDLGRGTSLNKQFFLYRQYESNVTDGGKNGEEKFEWLIRDSKDKRILYVCFWDENLKSYLIDLEYIKKLSRSYQKTITFVLISFMDDELKWQQLLVNYNLFSDGIVNYRIGKNSPSTEALPVKQPPAFILISKEGEVSNSKRPSDPSLEADLRLLTEQRP